MLTDEDLLMERKVFGGVQRLYRFSSGSGLSIIKISLECLPFHAWNTVPVRDITDDGMFEVTYTTALGSTARIFHTDEEANAFIAKAKKLFTKEKTMKLVVEVERVGRIVFGHVLEMDESLRGSESVASGGAIIKKLGSIGRPQLLDNRFYLWGTYGNFDNEPFAYTYDSTDDAKQVIKDINMMVAEVNSPELRPCPTCGNCNPTIVHGILGDATVTCKDCGHREPHTGRFLYAEKEAISLWNGSTDGIEPAWIVSDGLKKILQEKIVGE